MNDFYNYNSPYREDIKRIMDLIKQELKYIYKYLKKFNISDPVTDLFLRTIVTYVLEQNKNYKGTTKEKLESLLYGYKTKYPWIMFLLSAYKVPFNRVEEIIKIVIAITLENIKDYPTPDPYFSLRVDKIFNEVKDNTNINEILKYYKVPNKKAKYLGRTTIEYTLRYKDKFPLYDDYSKWTTEILIGFMKEYPYIIDELKGYGMPLEEIRNLLRRIIRYTLKNDVIV